MGIILPVTLTAAAAAAIINLWLAVRVGQMRGVTKTIHGDDAGGPPRLLRASDRGAVRRGPPGAVRAYTTAARQEPSLVPGHTLDGAGAGFVDIEPAIILSDRAGREDGLADLDWRDDYGSGNCCRLSCHFAHTAHDIDPQE